MRFFNTAGPVDPADHYCLDPLVRIDLPFILPLIEQKKYFVLHAPRQTGKTSCLLALQSYLNARDRYRCLYVNVEGAQAARENVTAAMQAILHAAQRQAGHLPDSPLAGVDTLQILANAGPYDALHSLLERWSQASDRPLVVLFDEVDALIGDTLIAFLRQLRAGYTNRPARFPQTVMLCGVRDVRDYRIHSAAGKEIITGGSAFNIKAESLRLGNLSEPEVRALYQQHTTETGQVFTEAALARAWDLSRGQPWLVNALAYECCFRQPAGRDRSRPIDVELIEAAREALILHRETHLDQLTDKLREPRVQRVIEPLLSGERLQDSAGEEDIQYVLDLGLIDRAGGEIAIANAIYREIIPRQLTYVQQLDLEAEQKTAWYVRPDGRLDAIKLLAAFQAFFRENAEHWLQRFTYQGAGPQLLMQAFLQRIVNGGGYVEREYGLGRGRTDLMVVWRHPGGVQRIVIELKMQHHSPEKTLAQGLEQITAYLDRVGEATGHLVIFDRRDRPWEEKIYRREEHYRGRTITVWGC